VGAIVLALLAGFVVFAREVVHSKPSPLQHADGIVILTGGSHRLAEAARLLADGYASRLLISGANRVTSREALHSNSGISHDLFDCCVDIGYEAQDTPGNAHETMEWAAHWRFKKLIVVTSTYHMPRSLTEIGRALPDVELIAYPVIAQGFRREGWWRNPALARILVSEYLKFIPSAARLGVARLLRSLDGSALAGGQAAKLEH
jgi:uncharacterized SAM-binding protein YcdF (DUF218 family)